MTSIKDGARIAGLRPEMAVALIVATEVYREHGFSVVVTEGTGGRHSAGSLHYVGLALDLRTRDIPGVTVSAIWAQLRSSLGMEYDVVLESDHLHLEFQPKQGGTT